MYVNQAETSSNEQLPAKVKVAVSPNPSSDKLVVESNLLTATKDITYSILDGYGRVVSTSTKTLNNDYDKASFDVSEFAAGQYYILVKTDNGIRTERFTVQH
ncbi:MAG: T9SS type A sorting domain-containing protein [Saprospiraceae bacterium]|nr:T9SS type A sorting domain-containing protein [Saprospiraceae bacterium]